MEKIYEKQDLIQEEQQVLDVLIENMSGIIDSFEDKEQSYLRELRHIKDIGVYDNIYAYLLARQGLKDTEENRRKLLQARDELYDTRVKLFINDDKEKTELKIGDHDFVEHGNVHIISWARPICRPLWGGQMPENYEFDVYNEKDERDEHVTCQLKFRRNISMKFGRVEDVLHAFPLSKEEQEELIVDILTQELYERRADNTWRSIIRSIQKKQKEIVLAPLWDNIIVQGCAGSGKTMIMLQRLPIVLMDYSKVLQRKGLYVITPSKTYIQLAQNITEQLEITDIQMGILNEYYDYCIEKYHRNVGNYGEIDPSILLDEMQMNYVYSEQFIADIQAYFRGIIESVEFNLSDAKDLFGFSSENKENLTFSAQIRTILLELQAVINENNKVLATFYRQSKELYSKIKEFTAILRHRDSAVEREILKAISRETTKAKNARAELRNHGKDIDESSKENLRELIASSNNRIQELEILLADLENDSLYFTPFKELAEEILTLLDSFIGLEKSFEQNSTEEIYKTIDCVGELIGVYYQIAWRLKRIHDDKYLEFVDPLCDIYGKIENDLRLLQDNKEKYLDLEVFQKIIAVHRALGNQNDVIVDSAYQSFMKQLGIESVKKEEITAIKCSPYMYLQILFQFSGAPNGTKESLITIDEAQNIAPVEINLIKKLNDNHVVLNLFGDVNQHIEGTKGIDKWEELNGCMEYSIYEMQENYRNAEEITRYCNKRFPKLNMRALNTAGNGVHVLEDEERFRKAVQDRFMMENRAGLSAIIVKTKEEANYVLDSFHEYDSKIKDLTGEDFSVHRTRWNLITVSDAKGLEFRNVIVISGRMTENEKYIAYTRALDELVVFEKIVDVKKFVVSPKKEENDGIISHSKGEIIDIEPPKNKILKEKSRVKEYFEKCGLEVIDHRSKGGALWVVGEKDEIEKIVNEAVGRFNISGMYTRGKATKYRQGWCTKTKK
jgi:DNA helicase IV